MTMKTKLLGLMLLAGSAMFAAPRVSVAIGFGGGGYYPPPAYAYAPPCPGPGYTWVEGAWYFEGPRRLWRNGYWPAPAYVPTVRYYDRGYYGQGFRGYDRDRRWEHDRRWDRHEDRRDGWGHGYRR